MTGVNYQQIAIRIDALQLRERMLLLLASIALVFSLINFIGIQPLFEKQELLLQEINDQSLQIEVLQARSSLIGEVPDSRGVKPTIPLAKLQQELSSFTSKLQYRLDGMLEPAEAVSILEQVIDYEKGLSLSSVNTKLTPLTTIDSESVGIAGLNDVSRYELDLQLEGGYMDTLRYLRALEALPWNFFWSEISFAITDYPNATVNLAIYTLGQPRI